jgi:hypothetical protein
LTPYQIHATVLHEQAPHDGERNVFLIAHSPGRSAKPRAGQCDQLAIVPLPQPTCRLPIAGLELLEPLRNRFFIAHDQPHQEKPSGDETAQDTCPSSLRVSAKDGFNDPIIAKGASLLAQIACLNCCLGGKQVSSQHGHAESIPGPVAEPIGSFSGGCVESACAKHLHRNEL